MTEMSVDQFPADIQERLGVEDVDIPQYVDYFAPTEAQWVDLPDGKQRVQIKVFTEGQRRKYLSDTNQEFKMNARTKDLTMRSNAGDDLHALLKIAIVDWEIWREGKAYAFSDKRIAEALDAWPVAVVDHIAKAVQDINPWLRGEDDLEAMEAEYKDLGERIEELKAKNQKNG